MKTFQSLYDRNKHIRAIMKKLGFSRPMDLLLESSRIVEYPWILRNIPPNGRMLDIGSTGSQLPLMLRARKSSIEQVMDIDSSIIEGAIACVKAIIK